MTDDEFFERLRDNAAMLRYEPDEVMRTRIAANVRARIVMRTAPAVAQLLASWFRPLAASLAVLSLAAALGLAFIDATGGEPQEASFASNPVEVSMAGGYGVGD